MYFLQSYSLPFSSFAEWFWKSDFFDQRNQKVADDDRIGNSLCGSSEKSEQTCQKSHTDAVHDPSFCRDRRSHIIRCHEPCSQHQSASAQMRRYILWIKSMSAEDPDKYNERHTVGPRDRQIDHPHKEKEHVSDHNGDD